MITNIPIYQVIDTLPTNNLTVHMLQALDFVAPGEWKNTAGFDTLLRLVTGESDGYVLWHIRERAVELFNDPAQGYQRTMWMYRMVDKADSALGTAAMVNKVGNKFSLLSFLSRLTPNTDKAQAIDLCLKLVVELLAFCQLNGISVQNIGGFSSALVNYRSEALMRMAALICIDGLLPFGPDFTSIVLSKLSRMQASELEQDNTFRPLSSIIPGNNITGQLGFITQSFESVQGWIDGFLAGRGLTRESVVSHVKQFVDFADDKLDYLSAFFDITTNYYEHTGSQTVARRLIERAAADVHNRPSPAWAALPPPAAQLPPPMAVPALPQANAVAAPDPLGFAACDSRYLQLKQQYDAGQLTPQAFDAQLQQMMIQDPQGRWWSKERQSGAWHYLDTTQNRWVVGTPPGYASPPQGTVPALPLPPLPMGIPSTPTPPQPVPVPIFQPQQAAPAPMPTPMQAAPQSQSAPASLFNSFGQSPTVTPPVTPPTTTPAGGASSLFSAFGQSPSAATPPVPPSAPSSSLFQSFGSSSSPFATAPSASPRAIRGAQALHTLSGHTGSVRCVAFSPNGQMLASGSDDQTIRIWRVADMSLLSTVQGQGAIMSLAWTPDSQTVISGRGSMSGDRSDTSSLFQRFSTPTAQTQMDALTLWHALDGTLLRSIAGSTEPVASIAVHPNGQILASGGNDSLIRLWNLASGMPQQLLHGHTGSVDTLAFSPDGQILVSAGSDQTIRLWSVTDGMGLRTFQGHNGPIQSIAFSPDGQILASAGSDQTIRLLRMRDGMLLTTLSGHSGSVPSLAFSPDGQTLASGGNDQILRLWNISETCLIATVPGHSATITGVAWSPDGQTLATGSADQTIRLWRLDLL